MSIRNYEDVRKKLENQLELDRLQLSLWKNVKILKKKDGTDFANPSKSFENADWNISPSKLNDSLHPCLYVSGRDKRGCLQEFWINAYLFTDEMKDSDERKAKGTENWHCVRGTYILTPDEVRAEILHRIASLEDRICNLEKQLEISETVYNKFFDSIHEALHNLKNDCLSLRRDYGKSPTSLEYGILEALQNITSYDMR